MIIMFFSFISFLVGWTNCSYNIRSQCRGESAKKKNPLQLGQLPICQKEKGELSNINFSFLPLFFLTNLYSVTVKMVVTMTMAMAMAMAKWSNPTWSLKSEIYDVKV